MYVFAISVRKYFGWFYFHEFIREIWKKDIKFRNSSILSFKFLRKKKSFERFNFFGDYLLRM